ncbi:hypothetical protein [Microbacterium arborescens]|uniref:hypothetical protein n=1 Tax=Microbacterium arborescens TaxID=33883 RepID=UPI00278A665A|nr:hypothetical protein [Microbacterium arborescens]MDQ1215722.1 hypothetical protein [Microbacterium arborescens]
MTTNTATEPTSIERLEAGIEHANDMVIGASFAIMDAAASEPTRQQARYFQSLFSRIRDVLTDARRGYWGPGTAPDDWESHDSSRAALALADAVVAAPSDEVAV